jgi:hypothetical protein
MQRAWLITLLVVPVLLVFAPVTFAAKTYPSVTGDWLVEGTMTAKMCVKKYGCERASGPFSGGIAFHEDQNLELDADIVGQWSQSKSKIIANLNVAAIESMLNEMLYEELGEEGYLDITSMSFKAKVSKDGSQITNGKLYIKFEYNLEYYGEVFLLKGNITEKFTGMRTGNSVSMMATDGEEQRGAASATLVKLISTLLADNLLSKLGR